MPFSVTRSQLHEATYGLLKASIGEIMDFFLVDLIFSVSTLNTFSCNLLPHVNKVNC